MLAVILPNAGNSNADKGTTMGFLLRTAFWLTIVILLLPSLPSHRSGSASQVNPSVIQSGSCQVIQSTSSGTTAVPGGSLTYLDAGTVTINGPGGSGRPRLGDDLDQVRVDETLLARRLVHGRRSQAGQLGVVVLRAHSSLTTWASIPYFFMMARNAAQLSRPYE